MMSVTGKIYKWDINGDITETGVPMVFIIEKQAG